MKKNILILAIILLFAGSLAYANVVVEGDRVTAEQFFGAPASSTRLERTIIPETDSKYELGTSTKAWYRVYTDILCLTGDTCETAWPSGGGGGGDGFWATTSDTEEAIYVDSYVVVVGADATTTAGYDFEVVGSSLFDNFTGVYASTTALTATDVWSTRGVFTNLTATYASTTGVTATDLWTTRLTGTNLNTTWASTTGVTATTFWGALTGNVTGNVTGNADTATALAANAGNCASGYAPLGVDASGAVESCFGVVSTTTIDTYAELNAIVADQTLTHNGLIDTIAEINAILTGEDVASTSGNITGNAGTATALAADPNDCGAGDYAISIDASGNLTCSTPAAGGNNYGGANALAYYAAAGTTATGTLDITWDETANKLTFANASTTLVTATTFYGALTGNADTATKLAANGGNCGAGYAPLGIDDSGAVEGCFGVVSTTTIDTFAELDAIVADVTLVNTGSIDTLAELNAILYGEDVASTTATWDYVSNSDWTTQDDYPPGCSAGDYVTAIGDTLTCDTPSGSVVAGTANQVAYYENTEAAVNGTSTILFGSDETVTIGTGDEVMTIINDNVGIGTATPYAKLTVWSDGNFLHLSDTSSTTKFNIDSAGAITTCSAITSTGAITGDSVVANLFDVTGAADMDYGSADVTDHTFTTNDCTVILDGGITISTGDLIVLGSTQWNSGDEIDGTKIKDADYGDVVIDAAGDWQVSEASDLNCTDCINATEIEDIYLLDDGDVGTGVYDFGGATTFEIPNGAAMHTHTSVTGQIAIDTTSDQLRYYGGSATSTLVGYQEKCFTLASTTFLGYDNIPLWQPYKAIEVISVDGSLDTANTNISVTINDGTNDMTAYVASSTSAAAAPAANNTWTASERMEVDIGAPTNSGTPNWLNVCLVYKYTID